MAPDAAAHPCRICGGRIDGSGPAVALAGANGFDGPAFIPFVSEAVTLGTAGVEHIDCFVAAHGDRALAELLHAPKARAMGIL
jgi:hypothetical protein